ncbi:MAG TPA: Zn-ribbon domain-containing OB-fold protein [Chloroflexota bacterium]|nr:Zn-ribbon domain-containing OB-fold protein [Chloroflexota bacterium]
MSEGSEGPSRPLPIPQPETEYYWQRAREHELWIMRCEACGNAYFYPRTICPLCFSRDTRWLQASGRATLHAFSIVHRAPAPGFTTPYVAAIVELEEGPRMPTNLVGVEPDPAAIRIGMPLEVVFEDVTDEISLPQFRPVGLLEAVVRGLVRAVPVEPSGPNEP